MAMKMDVWQWGDVKGVDEELCNNLALFAEDNKIDCMNMTEKEFVDLKDEYLMKNYGNKGVFSKKSLKESKKFQYGDEIIKFLEKYGYNKRGEDFEQNKDYSTVTYMYAIPKGMRPQTPYVEFTVDADNDAFIFGEFFTDGRKGYSTEFDSVEDLEYFVSNANYSNVDLTEKNYATKSIKEKKFNPNDYFYELIELNGKKYKDWTVFEWNDIEDDFFKAYATWGKTFFNMYSGNNDSNTLVNDGKLMTVLDKNGVAIIGKELNEIAYELNELIRNYKKTESNKSARKSLKESVDGYIATDEDCNMSGKCWVLDGSYNFIMEFLQEWGIAPKDVKVKNNMTTLYNADGNPFGYVYQDEEVDIFVADKSTNWTWENHNPSTKRVKVTALDEIF